MSDTLNKKWVYTHMEYDGVRNTSHNPITSIDAKCQDDAVKKGMELWQERLKDCDDKEGAKKIEKGNDSYFRPSKPKARLEISLPTDPL